MENKKTSKKQNKDQVEDTDNKFIELDKKTGLTTDPTSEVRESSSPVCFAESDDIQEEYKIDFKKKIGRLNS